MEHFSDRQKEKSEHSSPDQKAEKGAALQPPAFNLTAQPMQQKADEKAIQKKKNSEAGDSEVESSGPEMAGPPMQRKENSGGLPGGLQAKMEQSMDADFSEVNIHKDSKAATDVGAHAFTQGNDVHFAPGQFNPSSQKGQELIGHELSHVVQQGAGQVKPTTQQNGVAINDDSGLEKSADEAGAKAARGEKAGISGGGAGGNGGGSLQMKSAAIQMKKADPKKRWNSGTFKKEYTETVDTSTLNKVESQYFQEYAAAADIYLKRPGSKWDGKTDMTGQMMANGAMRAYLKYEKDINKVIPVDFALAQAQMETHMNSKPRETSPTTHNPFNVGEYDASSASWLKDIDSTEMGVSMYYDLMAEDYLSTQTPEELGKTMKNEAGQDYASAHYTDYMQSQPAFIRSYILKHGGKMPSMEGNTQTTGGQTTETKEDESGLNMAQLAETVYNAMDGMGTDETAVTSALAQLKKDQSLIDQFRKVYKEAYGSDVVDDIKGDFSNTYLFGNQLDEALALLNITDTTQTTAGKDNGTGATGTTTAAKPERQADQLDRVHTLSNKDNSFTSSRWENKDGTQTKYAESFDEKLKIELKTEFGKEITAAEVAKMIADAEAKGDHAKAEEYRKKLFRANQYAVVEALNVDQQTADGTTSGKNAMGRVFRSSDNHEMYGKTKTYNEKTQKWSNQTYCNIYAYDVVTALGGYIPRLWWTSDYEAKAIQAMKDKKPFEAEIKYGETVGEVNANALNGWFDRVGNYFGWRKAGSMQEAQNSANDGNIVVLTAANKKASSSGHVSVILAERDQHQASRKDGEVDVPLTSQAGSSNYKYKAGSKWWEDSNHKNGGAWIFEGTPDSPLMKPDELGMSGNIGEQKETPQDTGATSTGTKTDPKTPTNTTQQPANTNGNGNANPIGTGEVTASTLNVRSGPATTNAKVGQPLSKGSKVTIYEEKNGWYRIGTGQWVSATYVTKTQGTAKPKDQKPSVDLDGIATKVHAAMAGWGTDEQGVYDGLAQLKHDDGLIAEFMKVYQRKFGTSVVDDIKGDFSNNVFGNELDTALGFLNIGGGRTTKPATGGGTTATPAQAGKEDQQKDQTPAKPQSNREAVVITGTVGRKCKNDAADVRKIQSLMGEIGLGTPSTGTCDKATISAIYVFQEAFGLGSDGQIGPTGETLKRMNTTPAGAMKNSKAAMQKDKNAPVFNHSKFDNPEKLYKSSDGMYVPEQFYGNMKRLITNVNVLGDNMEKMLHVNSGFRSPGFNATLEGSATASNHQFGQAIDISSPNYTSKQLYDKVIELIKAGKMADGGLGIYRTFIHYDVGAAGRRWDNR